MKLGDKNIGIDNDIYIKSAYYNHMKLVGKIHEITDCGARIYADDSEAEDLVYIYKFTVKSDRLSGKADFIPVEFRTKEELSIENGERVRIFGRWNCMPGEHFVSKMIAYSVERISEDNDADTTNLQIVAKLSKKSDVRETPFTGKQIIDALFYIPAASNKSEQFHCVCFDKQAFFMDKVEPRDVCFIESRVEYRTYVNSKAEAKYTFDVVPFAMKLLKGNGEKYDKTYRKFMIDDIPLSRLETKKR